VSDANSSTVSQAWNADSAMLKEYGSITAITAKSNKFN